MRLQVTRQVFEASKGRLKVVGRAGVGVDNVDLAAATEVSTKFGIWLSSPSHSAAAPSLSAASIASRGEHDGACLLWQDNM